jgi:hypothetical protein
MNNDETLQEIRDARAQIWRECGEDWNTLLSFYQALEQDTTGTLIKKPQTSQEHPLSDVLVA